MTEQAGLDAGQACLQFDDKDTCETHGDNDCIWKDGLFCYPNTLPADGFGRFGTSPEASPAGELRKTDRQDGDKDYMKDFMDDMKEHAKPDASQESPERVRVP